MLKGQALMKIEIDNKKPDSFMEKWPGQYDLFSHFEFIGGIPSVMFLITTIKENGKPNACFHAWSTFAGDGDGYFAILGGLGMGSHTYRNILREKEFCINFISSKHYDAALRTIKQNSDDSDEIAAGGFAAEPAATMRCPRIREAFLCLECRLHSLQDLSGKGYVALVTGRVAHEAVEDGHSSLDKICGPDGFMLNVHSPKDLMTGEGTLSAVATLSPLRIVNEAETEQEE